MAPPAIEARTMKERRTIILGEDFILAMERARRSELKMSASGRNRTQMVRKKEGSISGSVSRAAGEDYRDFIWCSKVSLSTTTALQGPCERHVCMVSGNTTNPRDPSW